MKSPYLFVVLRSKAEAASEQSHLSAIDTLRGSRAPVSETQDYDFLDANVHDLATYTLATFPENSAMNNKYFVVLDERSARDRTCVLVEIPSQVTLDDKGNVTKIEHKFHERDSYEPDPKGWLDDEGEETGTEELKCVRVAFEEANMANMLDDGHETIGTLAMSTYQTDGVYREGAAYPDEE